MNYYIEIEGEQIPYTVIRSERRSMAIEIQKGPRVIVRVPKWMKAADIERFIESKKRWIIEKYRALLVDKSEESKMQIPEYMTQVWLETEGAACFQRKVTVWAQKMQIDYGRMSIRDQKTRWGSCSSKGNLNFNWRLLMMPEEIMDYVVVHELAHRREMNHSPRFWQIVEMYIPDYQKRRQWLKENGSRYMEAGR